MVFNLLVIGLVGLSAYLWSTKGFFSALLNLVATVFAGALAFALWETVAMLLLKTMGSQQMVVDMAWGLGLGGTFGLLLAALSGLMMATISSDVPIKGPANAIGAAACGLLSGILATGIGAIAVSHVRSNPDFLGFQPIQYDKATGSIVRESNLWVPVDTLTAGLYGRLSEASLRSGSPLAQYRPRSADLGHLSRSGPAMVTLRNTARPGDAAVAGRYTVGAVSPAKLSELLTDTFDKRVQKIVTLDGEAIESGEFVIEGVVIVPGAGLKTERVNQIVFGAANVTLLVRDAEDTVTTAVQPVAMISQAQGDSRRLGRWRFDAADIFVTTVGGASEPPMAFEFVVPKGSVPQAIIVRNLRLSLLDPETGLPRKPFEQFLSVESRDAAVRSREILDLAAAAAPLDAEGAEVLKGLNTESSAIRLSNRMQSITINKTLVTSRGFTLDEKNLIIDGEGQFLPTELESRIPDRALAVESLAVDATTSIVQVDVGPRSALSLLGEASAGVPGSPTLVDNLDQRYEAVGFIYKDGTSVRIRFTPGRPITSVTELPSLTRSRTDQSLLVLFRVTPGVRLKAYAIGTKVVAELSPPLEVTSQLGR
jgi:hypothetical protein